MAQEKENFLETLFRIGALMGGAWITLELIRAFGQEYYICPHCGIEIQRGMTNCPHCEVKLKWKI
ncbi:MAG: zinc ribbon domain-containing protein [Candidatus Desantisbacteria bacterium]